MRWNWGYVDCEGRTLPAALQSAQWSGVLVPVGALIVSLTAIFDVGPFSPTGAFANGRRADFLMILWGAALFFGPFGYAVWRARAWTRHVFVGLLTGLALISVLLAPYEAAADRAQDALVKLAMLSVAAWYFYFKRETVRYYQSLRTGRGAL